MAIETVHLYLVGHTGDGAQGREREAGQPADNGAAAEVDTTPAEAVTQVPYADAFAQGFDDRQPDVPPVASARLQDRKAQRYVSAAEAAQPGDLKGDDTGQRGELAPVGPVTAKGTGLLVAAAGAAPRRGRLGKSLSHPAIQQPLDAALKALAGDRSHRPQDSSDLLQLPPRVRERTSLG
jgi:hypothetical protein